MNIGCPSIYLNRFFDSVLQCSVYKSCTSFVKFIPGLLNLFYLFIFACNGSSLLHVGFLQLRRVGATLLCGEQASHCSGFSCCGTQALGARASAVVAHRLSSCGSQALELRLSSGGTQAQLLCGMWDLPRPWLKPVSPALAGRFLTTASPGKSLQLPLTHIKE